MSRILFSPIGGSDPIRNNYDGSMLHICRNYLPDKIYLFLSHEMNEHHKKDNRYLYCIEELGKLCNHHFEVEFIVRDDLVDVQKYEIFYEEFRKCIADIEDSMSDDDELLLNIASGTPAMKSALLVLSALAEYPFKSVQVSTPLKRSNKTNENEENYEPEMQWECNMDNEVKSDSRCEEVTSVNLSTLLKVNILKKHLGAYDYSAAYQVAKEMKGQLSDECILYFEQALERERFNSYKVNDIAKITGYQPMPIRNDEDRILVEYILALQLKEKRGAYDDFIRAITPVIVKLFERALIRQCHIDISKYYLENENDTGDDYLWDMKKLQGSEVLEVLDRAYKGGFKGRNIYSVHLKELIIAFSDNKKLNSLANELRYVEEKVRNRAAHTMISITQDLIKKWTGLYTVEILQKMKELTEFVGINGMNKDVWDSYDEMNKKIFDILDKNIKFGN